MKSLYLLINFFSVLFPFLFSFHPRLKFHLHFKEFIYSAGLISLPFLIWDSWFTSFGVWGFNPDYISGIYIFNLPIEEVLFFFCIPFSCLFTIHCFEIAVTVKWAPKTENFLVLLMSSVLIFLGIVFFSRIYTGITFLSCGLVLLSLKYILKVSWLAKVMLVYPILLIPFFLVNGILTGTGLDAPVVWYNNIENLGVRVLTIPVEDFIYGFELILLNMAVFEYLKKRNLLSKT